MRGGGGKTEEVESNLGAPLGRLFLAEVPGVSHHGGGATEHLLLSLALIHLLLASRVTASSAIRIRTRFLAEEEWRRRKEEEERRREGEEEGRRGGRVRVRRRRNGLEEERRGGGAPGAGGWVSGSTLLFLRLVGVFRMPFTGVTVLPGDR